ncbi:MAG: PQ-loop domain-containing transporter [Ruminococcus sp.]|nr:PQ-loop domain-containing transporter [Ruminococcus sp.]
MTAAEILEAAMLICFGFSWPMSVWKNIKAKSAKNMSLPFIMLICSGYVAGIAAKLITHNLSYVLVVYFINLAIVSANVVVYFVNKKYDKTTEQKSKIQIIENQVLNRKVTSK